ncbi:hypothetical protein HDA32_002074 [Spinactinospora alkalitolerans]|uniref:Uncharacterized protein n=1 Tax=Spinactinospora alkalitolerans TaxID=687207 RepID=A0A852TY63_9ACTN|nr:hypothetical protein [Spinactinospora alkalitolerans]NYE46954.1 hypothetical protein [Spinactinospora alkalitolerans]
MFAIAGLVTVSLLGLLVIGFFALRMVRQLRSLESQVARTRAELEPRHAVLRELSERARAGAR